MQNVSSGIKVYEDLMLNYHISRITMSDSAKIPLVVHRYDYKGLATLHLFRITSFDTHNIQNFLCQPLFRVIIFRRAAKLNEFVTISGR